MKTKFVMLDSLSFLFGEGICEFGTQFQLSIKGWNRDRTLDKEYIVEQLEEYFEDTEIRVEFFEEKEGAYYTYRYSEGVPASDEGYISYLEYVDAWKKGYGKCTNYSLTVTEYKEVLNVKN